MGHSGIGCKHKDGTYWVFDFTGGGSYTAQKYADWLNQEASACDKGCKFTIEDLELNLTAKEANTFCERLAAKSGKWDEYKVTKIDANFTWDWHGRGGEYGHNCNSSITLDLRDTTSIWVPEMPVNISGYVFPADYYNRWGRHTVPWLRASGNVRTETASEHDCTGGGGGAGDGEKK